MEAPDGSFFQQLPAWPPCLSLWWCQHSPAWTPSGVPRGPSSRLSAALHPSGPGDMGSCTLEGVNLPSVTSHRMKSNSSLWRCLQSDISLSQTFPDSCTASLSGDLGSNIVIKLERLRMPFFFLKPCFKKIMKYDKHSTG